MPSSQAAVGADLNRSAFNDQARQLASELPSRSFISDSESRSFIFYVLITCLSLCKLILLFITIRIVSLDVI